MNSKSYIISVIATYVVMSILGVASQMVTMEQMASYVPLLRPQAELVAMAPFMYIGYLVITIFFCYIYIKGRETGGWMEGLKYGVIFGLMMSGMSLVVFATLPIDMSALITEIVVTIVIYAVGGITTALVYKPTSLAANDS